MASPAGSTSAFAQLRALIALRGTMVRSRGGKVGFLLLAMLVPLALVGAASAGQFIPEEQAFELSLVAPTVFLGFAILSVLSPLASGGGQDLYPPEQLVAYPVRASTQFLSGLAVLPLNLAWVTQLMTVVAAAFLLLPLAVSSLPAALVLGAYVLAVSAAGQLVAWFSIGLRRNRAGRSIVWGLVAVLAVGGILAVRFVGATDLLDASPTTRVVISVVNAGTGRSVEQLPTLTVLLALAAIALALGWRTCAWALHRPGDAGVFRESRPVRRRPDISLAMVDRASVWRSPSLRRGVLVLGLLPGGISAALGIDWTTLVILPGLVAAGAGLLFGVNAFCLDGTGAVWLASLPHDPALAIRAKTQVMAEACLGCVLLAVVAAALRVDRLPTSAELSALLCAIVVTIAAVVGTCLRFSTTRPHKAELRGPRDTPAPPGAMAVYSLRLAVGTTFLGLVLSGTAQLGIWWLPWLASIPAMLLAARRIVAAWSRWADPRTRSWVVTTVAAG